MNGAHILSQLRNAPSHICDISTIDGCNFQSDTTCPSLFYFHPLIFFPPCTHSLRFFSSHLALFRVSALGYFLLSALHGSYHLPFYFFFTPFAILLFFFTFYISSPFFSACLSYMSVPLCSNLSFPWSSLV